MGVYIKGIEMPSTCGKCKIKNAIECNRWKLVRSVALDRHRDCPLVPIPDHGRLIDIEPFIRGLYEEIQVGQVTYTSQELYDMIDEEIKSMPTIIPSSEEET